MIDEKVRKAHDEIERAESRRVSLFTVLAILVVLVGSFALLKSYGVVGRAISVPDNLKCAAGPGGATGILPVNVLGFTIGEESVQAKKNFCAAGADVVSSLGQPLNLLLLGDSCVSPGGALNAVSGALAAPPNLGAMRNLMNRDAPAKKRVGEACNQPSDCASNRCVNTKCAAAPAGLPGGADIGAAAQRAQAPPPQQPAQQPNPLAGLKVPAGLPGNQPAAPAVPGQPAQQQPGVPGLGGLGAQAQALAQRAAEQPAPAAPAPVQQPVAAQQPAQPAGDQITFSSQGKVTTFPRACVDDNLVVVEQSNKVAYGTCEGNNARIVTVDCACSQGACGQPGAAPAEVAAAPPVVEPAVEAARPIDAGCSNDNECVTHHCDLNRGQCTTLLPGAACRETIECIPGLECLDGRCAEAARAGAAPPGVQIPQPPSDAVVQRPGGVIVAAQPLCTDNDGSDFSRKGEVSMGDLRLPDFCNGNDLIEATCVNNDIVDVRVPCAGGCTDGVCAQPGQQAPLPNVQPRPAPAAPPAPGAQPPAGQCQSDADCGQTKWCDTTTFHLCLNKLADGAGCNFAKQCLANKCTNNKCGELKQLNSPCTNDEECTTGACIGVRQRTCKPKSNLGACDSNADCTGNNCIQNVCGGPVQQAVLNCVDEDAVRGDIDQQAMFKSKVTLGPREAYDDACNSDPQKATFVQERVCVNNNPSFQEYNCALVNKVCTQGACTIAGQPPAVQPAPAPQPAAPVAQPAAPARCQSDADCPAGKWCDTSTGLGCLNKLADGAGCNFAKQCISGSCTNNRCGAAAVPAPAAQPPAPAGSCQSNAECPRSVPIKVCKRLAVGQPKACVEQGIKDAYCESNTDCMSQLCQANKCAVPAGAAQQPAAPPPPPAKVLVASPFKVGDSPDSGAVLFDTILAGPVRAENPFVIIALTTNGLIPKDNVDYKAGHYHSYLIAPNPIGGKTWYRLNELVGPNSVDTTIKIKIPREKIIQPGNGIGRFSILAGKKPVAGGRFDYDEFMVKEIKVSGHTPSQAPIDPLPIKDQAKITALEAYIKNDIHGPRNKGPVSEGVTAETVICSELYRQGLLSYEMKKASSDYSTAYLDAATMAGYHFWAKPLVRVMQRSPKVTMLVAPLGLAWGRHMAFTMGSSTKDDAVGKTIADIGVPASKQLGVLLEKNSITSEVSEATMEALANKYLVGMFDGSDAEVKARLNERMPAFFAEIEKYAQSHSSK